MTGFREAQTDRVPSADVLYVTNGETTDYAHAQRGTLARTPELSEGCPGCGFVFPDDEALVQADGGWQVSGAPAGSATNQYDWERTTAAGFPVGASITTPESIFLGFGFEGISTQAERDLVMGRAMRHPLG